MGVWSGAIFRITEEIAGREDLAIAAFICVFPHAADVEENEDEEGEDAEGDEEVGQGGSDVECR